MTNNRILILLWPLVYYSVICDKICSREGSRIVRDYFTQTCSHIYEKHHISIPQKCIFSPKRDIFFYHELNKIKLTNNKWLCKYCNKTFYSEFHLDIHLSNRHDDILIHDENSVCLADYCSIFRCDVLKHANKSLRSFNLLTRNFDNSFKKFKKNVHEQQLIILRSRCASIVNQCIPNNIHQDIRIDIQHEMYAAICAYLTINKYFELPYYQKSAISFLGLFCFTIFIGICFITIGIIRRSEWRFNDDDDDESEKHLSEESISMATALLAKTPANGIIHSSRNSTSTVRHRVRFKFLDECPQSCSESI